MDIGIIITGHGKFASGLKSCLDMVGGDCKNIIAVDFLPEDDYKNLDREFLKAYDLFSAKDYVIVLADLLGASPFNRAYLSLSTKGNVRFIGNANFSLAYYLLSEEIDNIDTLIEESISKACKNIVEYK